MPEYTRKGRRTEHSPGLKSNSSLIFTEYVVTDDVFVAVGDGPGGGCRPTGGLAAVGADPGTG